MNTRRPLSVTLVPILALATAAIPSTSSAAPLGEVCAALNPGNFAGCVSCVVEGCETSGRPDVSVCVFEHGAACFPALPLPDGDTVPDIDIGTDTLWNFLVISAASTGTGYVLYQHGGRILGRLIAPQPGFGFAPAMVLVGLPFLLGNAAAHGFEDYVQNYAPCVNPVYDGTTYVCLGNSIATGPGAPGSSCPPGTQPQTGMYGTACVEVPNYTPPTPSCASLRSCEDDTEGELGPATASCGGESFDVEVECIGDGGATSTGMSCVTLCSAVAEEPPIAP